MPVLGRDHGAEQALAEVDVDQLGMVGDVAEVRLGRVVVLDQVVPEVPFPDDLAGRLAGRLDLDEQSGSKRPSPASSGRRPAAMASCGRLAVPDDHQHVAVGQPGDVVVRELLLRCILEVPDELAVPGELLDPAPRPGRRRRVDRDSQQGRSKWPFSRR